MAQLDKMNWNNKVEESDAVRFIDAGNNLKQEVIRILGVGDFIILTKFTCWNLVNETNVREIRVMRGRITLCIMNVEYDPVRATER